MPRVRAYATRGPEERLVPFTIDRREPRDDDVEIAVAFCGICHSDLHQAKNEWGTSTYPMVPGHEIVGRVTRVGKNVKRFRAGDLAGVGCIVDSCRACDSCRAGEEQSCSKLTSWTYNSTEQDGKTPTQGGYSSSIVVDQRFVLAIPASIPLASAAPLLCAGITTYSPLKRWGASKGRRVAVLGLGGLGHMAVKLAAAMGAEVTVLSRSESKRADARRLGAHDFAVTSGADAASLAGRFDLIVDTASGAHDVDAMLSWVRPRGAVVLVGAPPRPLEVSAFSLLAGSRVFAGSNIGGIAETQEMLDFCAEKKLGADVEVIPIDRVNEAYERMAASDVRYRFSIDLSTLA